MKKIIISGFLIFLFFIQAFSQTPEKFNYQGVIRNSSGELVENTNITVKLTLLEGSSSGTEKYSENHSVGTNDFGLFSVQIGSGSILSGVFSEIDWSNQMYLKIEVANPVGGTLVEMGVVQLLSVPYSNYSNKAKMLDNNSLYFTDSDTLFAVKDHDGNIVFAVFTDGAKVYVNEVTKGNVGGFAVSGRSPTKVGTEVEYLRVTPDSTRIYINDSLSTKGSVGGFAVSGRSPSKGGLNEYFNISGADTSRLVIINPSQPRMLWYPKSEAFLVGRVIIEHPDSVGINSVSTGYESKAIGDWSQAFGYKSIARGNYSTAIGKNAIANGINSFAFGNSAFALSSDAFAIGSGAIAIGEKSFAFGSVGVDTLGVATENPIAIGDYSFAIGLGTKSIGLASTSLGANTTASGNFSTSLGFFSEASGDRSIALGPFTLASGYGSASIGYRNIASGSFAFASGVGSTSEGYSSISLGAYCHATGNRSVAMGDACTADGSGSFAAGKGSEALSGAVALGVYASATGPASYAFGRNSNTNYKEGSFVFCDGIDKSIANATRDGQVVFLGTGGLNFYTTKDTAEINSFIIDVSGNVGIGKFNPTYKVDVVGDINISGDYLIEGLIGKFADYVFSENYTLESIEEHAVFMWKNKHLPSLKSAVELNNSSYSITERNEQMLEELEKAHIYIEQLNNRIVLLELENKQLSEKQVELEKDINMVKNMVKLKEK